MLVPGTGVDGVADAMIEAQKYDDDRRFGFGEGKRIGVTFCIEKDAG
jgi:hypothetical protein